jgi:N-acetylmuramoyl-L-alanine amidase
MTPMRAETRDRRRPPVPTRTQSPIASPVAILGTRFSGRDSPGAFLGAVLGAFLLVALLACGDRAQTSLDPNLGAEVGDVALARHLAERQTTVPSRAEAGRVARAIEARAVREGAGERAADLYALAAGIAERTWRVAGDDRDGIWALTLLHSASGSAQSNAACDFALRAGRLAGELAHDASRTFAELVDVRRRFAARGRPSAADADDCLGELEQTLSSLVAFRPVEEPEPSEAPAASAGVAVSTPHPPQIARLDVWPGRDSTRVVIVLDRPGTYRTGDEVIAGTTTPQTFVDLDGVDLGRAVPEMVLRGIVNRVRAQPTSTGSRVTLDLEGQAWRRTFVMMEPYRIVVDVARQPPFSDRGLRQVSRIVLDAGHGGKDTGAIGQGGTLEKEVTLEIADRAARVLRAEGLDVLLTRDDDRFVSLEERTARANAFSADLFVSIHCNASEGRTRRGLETYVLDTTRDEMASQISARENATTPGATAELASMLSSMRLADQAERSNHFARVLERSGLATLRMRFPDTVDGGVHPAAFYVLTGARMPAALVETGYISNPIEEQRLDMQEYRQLLADSIVNAVKAYREGR